MTTSNFNIGFCSIPITAQILSLLNNYPRSRFPFLCRRYSDKPSQSVAIEHMLQYSSMQSLCSLWTLRFSDPSGVLFASHSYLAQIMARPNPCSPRTFPLQWDGAWAVWTTSPLPKNELSFSHWGKAFSIFSCKQKPGSTVSEMTVCMLNENSQPIPAIR